MIIENIYNVSGYSTQVDEGTIVYVDNIFTGGSVTVENITNSVFSENIFHTNNFILENIFSTNQIENYFPTYSIHIEDVYTTTTGAGSSTDISFIEAELLLKSSNERFVEFVYSGSDIVEKNVYTTPSKTVQLYAVTYTYTGSDLTSSTIERIEDGYTYTKTYNYSSGNLISVNYEQV